MLMRLARVRISSGDVRVAQIDGDSAQLLRDDPGLTLASLLHRENVAEEVRSRLPGGRTVALADAKLLSPIDQQEVWAAGVTYKRSQVARMQESEAGASHYDKVYTAPRPEIFFKATPARVSGPGEPLRVRADSRWSVPEPELALVVSPAKRIVGITIGNDMSARDIEGENPLYLPQAKVYNQCCGLGPCVWIPEGPIDRAALTIELKIRRGGQVVFTGETHGDQMKRSFEELVDWLTRENDVPTGAILLTGTGIVPPDQFTLENGDEVSISVANIGELVNPIVKA